MADIDVAPTLPSNLSEAVRPLSAFSSTTVTAPYSVPSLAFDAWHSSYLAIPGRRLEFQARHAFRVTSLPKGQMVWEFGYEVGIFGESADELGGVCDMERSGVAMFRY